MMTATPGSAEYWDGRYDTIGATKVSWFQSEPTPSLAAIAALGITTDASIVDVGGGASNLADALLATGFHDITVVDLSQRALDVTAKRLGAAHPQHTVQFVQADVREWRPERSFDLWHDRAAYHFLTDPADQQRYWDSVRGHVVLGGHVVIATFAEDGPEMCSGLPVQRNSAEQLIAAMGAGFEMIAVNREMHTTPSGGEQRFVWVTVQRV